MCCDTLTILSTSAVTKAEVGEVSGIYTRNFTRNYKAAYQKDNISLHYWKSKLMTLGATQPSWNVELQVIEGFRLKLKPSI